MLDNYESMALFRLQREQEHLRMFGSPGQPVPEEYPADRPEAVTTALMAEENEREDRAFYAAGSGPSPGKQIRTDPPPQEPSFLESLVVDLIEEGIEALIEHALDALF